MKKKNSESIIKRFAEKAKKVVNNKINTLKEYSEEYELSDEEIKDIMENLNNSNEELMNNKRYTKKHIPYLVRKAYKLANKKEGFKVWYTEPEEDLTLQGEREPDAFTTITQEKYYNALHNNVWENMTVPQRLATLILLERDLANEQGEDKTKPSRKEAKLSLKLLKDMHGTCEIRNGKSIFYIDLDTLQDDENNMHYISYIAAENLIYLGIQSKALEQLERFNKSNREVVYAGDNPALIANIQMMIPTEEWQQKFYNGKKLSDIEEKKLCVYYSQPIQVELNQKLDKLETLALYNQSGVMGIGLKDSSWQVYQEHLKDEKEKIEKIWNKHFNGMSKKSLYSKYLLNIRSNKDVTEECDM